MYTYIVNETSFGVERIHATDKLGAISKRSISMLASKAFFRQTNSFRFVGIEKDSRIGLEGIAMESSNVSHPITDAVFATR